MLTYFIYKLLIFDCIICDLILDKDPLTKAAGIIATIVFGILGLASIVIDIIALPLYLIMLLLWLILKVINILKENR